MSIVAEPFVYASVAAMAGGQWTIPDQAAVVFVPGWNAPNAVHIAGVGKVIEYAFAFSGVRTVAVQVAVRFVSKYNTDKFFQIRQSTNQIFALAIGDNGTVTVRDRLDTVIATLPASTFVTNQWHYLEVWVQQGNFARAQLRVDDVVVADLRDIDTNVATSMTLLSLGCERGGTTWSELVVKSLAGSNDNDPSGPMTRIKPGWYDTVNAVLVEPSIYLTTPVVPTPNALLEMVGLVRVRQPSGAPAPRQAMRLVGGQAVDEAALQAVRWNLAQAEPLIVPLAADAITFSPPNWASAELVLINPTGARAIRSFDALVTSFVKYLVNIGSATITLSHSSGSATASENRLVCVGATDISLTAGKGCWLVRHKFDSRWRALPT